MPDSQNAISDTIPGTLPPFELTSPEWSEPKPAGQFPDSPTPTIDVPVACTCRAHPYPHFYTVEHRMQARAAFDYAYAHSRPWGPETRAELVAWAAQATDPKERP